MSRVFRNWSSNSNHPSDGARASGPALLGEGEGEGEGELNSSSNSNFFFAVPWDYLLPWSCVAASLPKMEFEFELLFFLAWTPSFFGVVSWVRIRTLGSWCQERLR